MGKAISLRKRTFGWYFFDWASQPYNTLLLTFIFGPYFADIARTAYMAQGLTETVAEAQAQALWGWGLTGTSLVILIFAPILGAIADGSGRRLPWVWVFSIFYVVGAASLWTLMPGDDVASLTRIVLLFGIGFIGMEFATIFTNAMMPSLSEGDELGKISGNGFAFGYLGGLIALFIMLLLFAENAKTGKTLIGLPPLFGLDPAAREGTRAVGPFAALWYIVFMIPFFLWVKEGRGQGTGIKIGAAMRQLRQLLASLRHRKSLLSYLGASLCYRDALNALYTFGGFYALNVLDWEVTQIGIFGILGGLTAMIGSYIGGHIDMRRGPKPVIIFGICVLIVTCSVIVGLTRESLFGVITFAPDSSMPDVIFYICGALIGAVGGPIQAASRSLLLRHTDADHATEAFGLYALSGKVASLLSPALVALVSQISESPRIGITPVIFLFLLGLALLAYVKPLGERT